MVSRIARARPRSLAAIVLALAAIWSATHPRAFIGLWLTPDQRGHLLFARGDYARAARHFDDPRWRGLSLYAAQDFGAAARYFAPYQDAESLLAHANALAHGREYLAAREAYGALQARYPGHPASAVNLPIVQRLIDANRQRSEDRWGETGDPSAPAPDGSRSSEGDERGAPIERERLDAQALLDEPGLAAIWLRQVQRDPAEFLSTKFYRQLEARERTP